MATRYGQHVQDDSRPTSNKNIERLAKGLGWFSIGLGLAEIVAPGALARLIGMKPKSRRRSVLRFYGFRELAAGVGILSRSRPAGWMWSRVAGDLIDLASLGSAVSKDDVNRTRAATATAAVVAVTALDAYCGQQLSRGSLTDGRIHETKTIIIDRSPDEVYSFWRNFENLPRFIDHLESVQVKGDGLLHWKAKAPAGTYAEWDAEIVRDEPNSRIVWRSVGDSDIDISGSVSFERATGDRGTLVRVELNFAPPGGRLGAGIAKLFGAEPGQRVESGLRLLKQILETGGIVRSDASIHPDLLMHTAQPPKEPRREGLSVVRERGTNNPAAAGAQ